MGANGPSAHRIYEAHGNKARDQLGDREKRCKFAPSFRSMVGIGFPNRLTGPDITRTGLQESPTERILYAELSANFTNRHRESIFKIRPHRGPLRANSHTPAVEKLSNISIF